MTIILRTAATACLMVLMLAVASARADRVRAVRPGGGAEGGTVNIPYVASDNMGNQWMIYQGGWLRQQGNMPVYSQAAMLMINNNHVQHHQNQARRDPETGEILFEDINAGPVTVTRRILIDTEGGFVRYVDIFKNAQQQEQSFELAYQTNFNYGVQSSATVDDPKAKGRPMAWVAQMQTPRAILEVYAGRGAKDAPQIMAQPEGNTVRAQQQLTIPAGKSVAIVHLHGTAATQQAAAEFVESIKPQKLLADLPKDLRKLIVNFPTGNQFLGDREVLRGELFDVVELRSGDLVNGTLKAEVYKLQTFYGEIELRADRVVGLINVGQFRPRQLVVTVDGEVFGGQLAEETVALQLASGQVTNIPLSQVSRVGYRKRAGEPEEWTFKDPMIMLRSGERMSVALPQQPIDVLTRYGSLSLRPESIGAIVFQVEEHGVHQVHLTDGSAFAALAAAPQFQMTLLGAGGKTVTFPTPALSRLQLMPELIEPDEEESPIMKLNNGDVLVGAIDGQLKLDTTFDTITIRGAEVQAITHAPEAPLDVQVTLWDQTIVSGQLQDPQLVCALGSGVSINVPVALVEEYYNPNPRPSGSMVERIREVAAELSADDWQRRESAQEQLITMGPVVASVLRELYASQPPEAQQRIEAILKELGKPDSPLPATQPSE